MIERKELGFKCDFCGGKGQSAVKKQEDDYGGEYLGISLPGGWVGDLEHESFCSKLCKIRFELHTAREKIKALRIDAECRGHLRAFEKSWNAPGLEKYANDMSWEEVSP